MTKDLDAQLIAAHDAQDTSRLITLYTTAADQATDKDSQGFFLTHAYVFALERGDRRAAALRERLVTMGREPDQA